MSVRSRVSLFLAMPLSLSLLAGCAGSAQKSAGSGSNAANYYAGKTVTLIVPNSPGGNMDNYARMIVPYLKKHLGASDIVVKNVTGAGGVVGTNQLWNSKPDGLTVAFTSVPTIVLSHLAGSEGVQFDGTKFTYLGRASTEPRVLTVGGKSTIKSVKDIQNLGRPFKFPSQGTDEDFYTMAVLSKSLGFQLQTISGYEGNADTSLAVIKGDGDGHITGVSAIGDTVKTGDKRPILVIASERDKAYPDVPTALEAVSGTGKGTVQAIVNIMEMHRSFFGPPNMDKAATEAFRKAAAAALNEKELVDKAAASGLPITFMDGATQQTRVAEIAKESQNIIPALKEALAALK